MLHHTSWKCEKSHQPPLSADKNYTTLLAETSFKLESIRIENLCAILIGIILIKMPTVKNSRKVLFTCKSSDKIQKEHGNAGVRKPVICPTKKWNDMENFCES